MLTQLATVRSRLGLTDLEIQWDALLTQAILAVSARFNHECGGTLARSVDLAQEFCPADREIILRSHPVEAITRLELKTTEAEGWQEQTGVDFLLRHRCVLTLLRPLGTDAQQGRVIYTGGFVLPGTDPAAGQAPLPPDLEQAAVEQVCWWFQNRERLGLTRLWEYHGTYRQFADLDLLTTVRSVLNRYAVF